MNGFRTMIVSGGMLICGAGGGGITLAAENESTTSQDAISIQEVVVTARLKEETLQDVPMAITAFSAEQLVEFNAKDLADYASFVPGLTIFSRNAAGNRGQSASLSIRGINGGVGELPIGYYVNDTPLNGAANLKMFDVERVEVLKGPQGTLYGGRALGGLIKIVTAQANLREFSANVGTELSGTQHGGLGTSIDGMVNIPLIADKLAVRLVGYGLTRDGYVDRYPGAVPTNSNLPPADFDYSTKRENEGAERTYGGRVSLVYQATDDLALRFNSLYDRAYVDGKNSWNVQLSDAIDEELVSGIYAAEPSTARFFNTSLTADYKVTDGINLLATGSYTHRTTNEREDSTYFASALFRGFGITTPYTTPVSFITTTDTEIYTAEVRLLSASESPFQWLIGGFYEDIAQVPPRLYVVFPGLADLINGALGTSLTSDVAFDYRPERDYTESGAFAEISYRFFDKLTATVGLRYYDTDLENRATRPTGFFVAPPQRIPASGSGTIPKFALKYEFNKDSMLYGSATQGYRPAGSNGLIVAPPSCQAELAALGKSAGDVQNYESDELWQYELGMKKTFLGGRVSSDAAAFLIDWSDKQQQVSLACGFGFAGNLGSSTIKGVELSGNALVTERFSFGLTASYIDAQSDDTIPALRVVKGDPLPMTPKWQASAHAEYSQPVATNLHGFVRADYSYRDDIFEPNRKNVLPSYGAANLRVGVAAERYDLTAYVENLTDKRGIVADESFNLVSLPTTLQVFSIRPRTIGVNARFRF